MLSVSIWILRRAPMWTCRIQPRRTPLQNQTIRLYPVRSHDLFTPNYHETILLYIPRWRISPANQAPDAGLSAHRGDEAGRSTSRRQLRDTAMPRHHADDQPADVLDGRSDPAEHAIRLPRCLPLTTHWTLIPSETFPSVVSIHLLTFFEL